MPADATVPFIADLLWPALKAVKNLGGSAMRDEIVDQVRAVTENLRITSGTLFGRRPRISVPKRSLSQTADTATSNYSWDSLPRAFRGRQYRG